MQARGADWWLRALADPAGPKQPFPARFGSAKSLKSLLDLADIHGVLPAVVTNLRSVACELGPDRIIRTKPNAPNAQETIEAALDDGQSRLRKRTVMCLLIRRQADELTEALSKMGIPVVVLKGPEFADRLYPGEHLRTFTDADLLVPRSAMDETDAIMRDLDYRPAPTAMKYNSSYGERKYSRKGTPGGTVEIHWNLVNSPSLRSGVSVEFEDLQFSQAHQDGRNVKRLSAGSLLLIAAVHAAASHCFDRLQLLYDICQASRGAAGEIDTVWLSEAIDRTGAGLSMRAALDLTGNILGERQCGQLLDRLALGGGFPWWRALLTRGVVLRGHAWIDSFRRNIFRAMLKKRR